jgi:hypothetical protein
VQLRPFLSSAATVPVVTGAVNTPMATSVGLPGAQFSATGGVQPALHLVADSGFDGGAGQRFDQLLVLSSDLKFCITDTRHRRRRAACFTVFVEEIWLVVASPSLATNHFQKR